MGSRIGRFIFTFLTYVLAGVPLSYGLNIPYSHGILIAVGVGAIVSAKLIIAQDLS
jgi:hypothetical protein